MPQALEITYFHNILEQNVLGNTKLLNEQKSRISNWIRSFLTPFPRDWKNQDATLALIQPLLIYFHSETLGQRKKGKESKI